MDKTLWMTLVVLLVAYAVTGRGDRAEELRQEGAAQCGTLAAKGGER